MLKKVHRRISRVFLLGIVTLTALLFSCGDQPEQKPLSMDDILESSEKYKEGDTLTFAEKPIRYFDSLRPFSQFLLDTIGLDRDRIERMDTLWFPDRFTNKSVEKFRTLFADSPVEVGIWTYSDSNQTKNALFNWLDCFGKRCHSLQLHESKNVGTESFLLFTTNKRMIVLFSPKTLDTEKLLLAISDAVDKEVVLHVISQKARGKVIWWKQEKKVWTEINADDLKKQRQE